MNVSSMSKEQLVQELVKKLKDNPKAQDVMRIVRTTELVKAIRKSPDATVQEKVTAVMFLTDLATEHLLKDAPESVTSGLDKLHGILISVLGEAGLIMTEPEEAEALFKWAHAGCPPRHNYNLGQELKREIAARESDA